MKLTPDILKKMIKESIRTEFPMDLDQPDPELAPKMEAVSTAVETEIKNHMEEMVVELGNIVVTMNPNEKPEILVGHAMDILRSAGFKMPERSRYAEILKTLEKQAADVERETDDWYDERDDTYSQQGLSMSENKKRRKK